MVAVTNVLRKNHDPSKCSVKIPPCELCNSLNHNKLFCKTNIPESQPVIDVKQSVVASLAMNTGT